MFGIFYAIMAIPLGMLLQLVLKKTTGTGNPRIIKKWIIIFAYLWLLISVNLFVVYIFIIKHYMAIVIMEPQFYNRAIATGAIMCILSAAFKTIIAIPYAVFLDIILKKMSSKEKSDQSLNELSLG